MKRIILIVTVFAVCILQSVAQNVVTDTLQVSTCNNVPYYYQKHNGLIIQCTDGLQSVDTIIGSLVDSTIIYVNLTVMVNPVRYEYATLCQNKTLNFRNNNINAADYPPGTTTLHYQVPSAYSCDTLMTLFLTVVPAYNDTIEDKICLGEPYHSNGFGLPEQNTAGTFYYTKNLQSHYGCDSIVTLKLTVNSPKDTTIYAGICEGEIYSENGFNESAQGTYTRRGTSAEGCDSTAILILNVYREGENRVIDAEICEGNIYQANGFNESETGTYIENRVTNDGCQYSITLNLTVLLNLKMDTLPLVGDICGDAADFPVRYNVFAGRIDSIFVSFDEKAHNAGFEDFVEHNPSIDNIKIPLPTDIRPDNYSVTLYFDGRCNDTIFTVNFTVLYPSSVMEQRWNDVIILKNPAYNGGYDFYDNKWLVNGFPIEEKFDNGSYIYTENATLQFGSEYRALLTRADEYQRFCSCPLIPIQHFDVYEFPRIVSEMRRVKVYSNEPIVELSLINILGQTVINNHYANSGNTIEIGADAGIYVIRLATDKGQIYTQKITVQQ
ncbi:hypothetical protein FACS189434_12510 [Bacteroidia bacterium]|nr:hypothetical protein FACS189434_12510 [Bacteroidia bacterium]